MGQDDWGTSGNNWPGMADLRRRWPGRFIGPSTGTPVPGGLSHWGAVDVIESLFSSEKCNVIGADVNEIVPGTEGTLTQFSAALIATKIVACHIADFSNRGE